MAVTQDAIRDATDDGDNRRFNIGDGIWATLVALGGVVALAVFHEGMNRYEVGVLVGTVVALVALGWRWPAIRALTIAVAVLSLGAIALYGDDLAMREQQPLLRYLLSGTAAVVWMSTLYVLATVTYFAGLASRSDFVNRVATAFVWSATAMGLTAIIVRWRETHLLDFGYFPISSLYEVFVLFPVTTALIYLYYQRRYRTYAMGGFAMLIIAASIAFLQWYMIDRQAHAIEPLVPALQSWWMTVHVPTNFVGYGAFALAAMLGVAYLVRARGERVAPGGFLATHLPSRNVLDDVMYKSVALGFFFFTIATILGALWAAEAWGAYWQWDPKETWALIVWLNYAAWLHMRLTKGWQGPVMAWWAIVGLLITLFAFLGVNMFLAGLHSYGEL